MAKLGAGEITRLVQLGEGSAADLYMFNSVGRFMPTLAGFLYISMSNRPKRWGIGKRSPKERTHVEFQIQRG